MLSPFLLVALSYLIALLLYSLGFSNLFPSLTIKLLVFLLLFCVFSFIAHWLFRRSFEKDRPVSANGGIRLSLSALQKTVVALYLGLILEFVHARGIPLLGGTGSYTTFGIPTFHVLLMTSASFVSLLIAAKLCFAKKHRIQLLFLYGATLLIFLLVVNRGLFALSVGSGVFYWLLYRYDQISTKIKLGAVVLGILGLYMFGLFGNFRTQRDYHQISTITDTAIMMRVGGATDSFKESSIPKPFFWAYTYVASPLANLQKTMTDQDPKVSADSVKGFFLQTFIWDFISKHFPTKNVPQVSQISPELNVSTAFSAPYLYLGFSGVILFAIFLLVFPFVYFLLLHTFANKYRYLGLATLCTIYAFMFFIDFLTYTGLSVQLIFPFILEGVSQTKQRIRLRRAEVTGNICKTTVKQAREEQ